jgi:hypothetical protein
MRNVTLLDIRLRHVQLDEEQRRTLENAMVPVLVDVTERLLKQAAPQPALDQVAASR